MHTYETHQEEPLTWREIRNFVIVLVYVVLVCDHSWWINHLKPRDDRHAHPGTIVYAEATNKIIAAIQDFRQKKAKGELTPEAAAEIQWSLVNNFSLIGDDWSDWTTLVAETAREKFVSGWQPPAEDIFLVWRCTNEKERHDHAFMIFHQKITKRQDELRQREPPLVNWDGWPWVLLWFIKWYYFLTIPALVIMFLNRWLEKGETVKEEVLLAPLRLLLWCGIGPLGVLALSETTGKVYLYRKLRDELIASRPVTTEETSWRGPRISKEEEGALWRQVYQPLLSFDEALASFKKSGEKVKRPVFACLVLWLTSFSLYSGRSAETRVTVAVTMSSETTITNRSQSDHSNLLDFLLALLPAAITWPKVKEVCVSVLQIAQPVQRCSWNSEKPRGPPNARRQHPFALLAVKG